MGTMELYRYLFEEIADPRVANWPLMRDPVPMALILASYLAFVLHVGPRYMKNRKPYNLNNFMIVYNVAIAVASALVFYGILTSGYTTTLSLGCEPLVISYEPENLKMAHWIWWVMILKTCELGDTIIFVLRKKYNQTSFLHVYHHVVTCALSWLTWGMWTFMIMPNCLVHVIMYSYYLLACFGPEMQKKIMPWKKSITRLQLLQFGIMFVHTCQSLVPSCEPNRKFVAYVYMSQVITIASMFMSYYQKSYLSKKAQ